MFDRKLLSAAILATTITVIHPQAAVAAPCAGFTDVDDTSLFCPNVEWIKNRGVTLGCTSATAYCPADPVTRVAMAAFMNRLGNALTPAVLHVEGEAPGYAPLPYAPPDGPDGNVICQTADYPVTGFPRVARGLALVSGTPANHWTTLRPYWRVSTDGGANWTLPSAILPREYAEPGQSASVTTTLPPQDLVVGTTYRFGIAVDAASGVGVIYSYMFCQVDLTISSRTGAASPY
jgi:hypothetical protein